MDLRGLFFFALSQLMAFPLYDKTIYVIFYTAKILLFNHADRAAFVKIGTNTIWFNPFPYFCAVLNYYSPDD